MKLETEGANKQMEVRGFLERARYINMEIDSKLEHVTAPVSYTHLTLPTIYSV